MSDEKTLDLLQHAIVLLEETSARLDQLNQRIDSIEQQLQGHQSELPELITAQEAANLLKRNRKTLEIYRKKYWTNGIHYFPQDKDIFYNRPLLEDWQKNRHEPDIHQRSIEQWQAQQMNNQRRKPGRRKAS